MIHFLKNPLFFYQNKQKKIKSPSAKRLKGFVYKDLVKAGRRVSQLLYE